MKPSKIDLYAKLFLFVFACSLYSNTIAHSYALDDYAVIVDNQFVQMGIAGIPQICSQGYWGGYKKEFANVYYRPLAPITYALEAQFFPDNPHISHLNNTLFYALTAVMLYATLRLLLHNCHSHIAFATTLLFIAHPVHTEVVANIKGRIDILFLLGSITCIYCLLKYRRCAKIAYLIASCTFFFLAFLAKGHTIVFLAVIPLVLYFANGAQWPQIARLTLLFFIVTIVYLGLRSMCIDGMTGHRPPTSLMANSILAADNLWDRWATVVYILGKYIWLLLVPHPLVWDYSYNHIPIVTWFHMETIVSLLVYLGLIFYSIAKLPVKNWGAFAVIYFLATLSLVANIFFLIRVTMAERFLYAPSLGFCLLLVYLLFFLCRHKTRCFYVVIVVIVVAYSWKTIDRNRAWQNNFTLFATDIRYLQSNARARLYWGSALRDKGLQANNPAQKSRLLARAIREINAAIAICPQYARSYYTLARTYYHCKRYKEAEYNYNQALLLNPSYSLAYNQRGALYFQQQQYQKAQQDYNAAIRLNPEYPQAYNNRGLLFFHLRKYRQAQQDYDKAIQLRPEYAEAYNNRGLLFLARKLYSQARKDFDTAIRIRPQYPKAYCNRGALYLRIGEYRKAGKDYNTAIMLDAYNSDAYANRGILNCRLQLYQQAIADWRRAIALDPAKEQNLRKYIEQVTAILK